MSLIFSSRGVERGVFLLQTFHPHKKNKNFALKYNDGRWEKGVRRRRKGDHELINTFTNITV